jgi:hypothetical protein
VKSFEQTQWLEAMGQLPRKNNMNTQQEIDQMRRNLEEQLKYSAPVQCGLGSQDAGCLSAGQPQKLMGENNWIKMSDLQPTESDYPIWAHDDTAREGLMKTWHIILPPVRTEFSHWMNATKIPAPPVKEITRDKSDFAIYSAWWNLNAFSPKADSWPAWAAAINSERSSIRALIAKYRTGELPAPELIRQLQERVKL